MSSTSGRSLVIPIVILSLIYLVSIVFFHFVEGWNFLDAAYYPTVTIATVGYGDLTPKTSIGKIGAIILIFSGVSTGLYVITLVGLIREKTIDPHVQRRLEILRNLTALQTGSVDKSQMKAIKEKIENKPKTESKSKQTGKNQGFGRL
ncbi:two pore domain potassium channel family protein [Candidatus Micrarchaeota archaeon]|nr:two pore domain potassium channel family protein [Candidatus Micrarchaeota archaeon]